MPFLQKKSIGLWKITFLKSPLNYRCIFPSSNLLSPKWFKTQFNLYKIMLFLDWVHKFNSFGVRRRKISWSLCPWMWIFTFFWTIKRVQICDKIFGLLRLWVIQKLSTLAPTPACWVLTIPTPSRQKVTTPSTSTPTLQTCFQIFFKILANFQIEFSVNFGLPQTLFRAWWNFGIVDVSYFDASVLNCNRLADFPI